MGYRCAIGVVCLLLCASGAIAQGRGAVEMGVDAGVTAVSYHEFVDRVDVDLPVRSFRAGWFLSNTVELEVALQAQSTVTSDNVYGYFDLGPAVLVHFGADPKRSRPFLLLGMDLDGIDFEDYSDTDEIPKAAFGFKLPISGLWALRTSFQVRYWDRDRLDLDHWEFGPLVGISVFTK